MYPEMWKLHSCINVRGIQTILCVTCLNYPIRTCVVAAIRRLDTNSCVNTSSTNENIVTKKKTKNH
jgi:hypothetical protein